MKICVIGGGASGMLASGIASKFNQDVTLFEKNEKLGKKIYITGKGRCNVTNDTDVADFLKQVVSNSKFLMSSLYTFTPQDLMSLIENEGIKLKVERGNRVFPESDKSSDIIKALERFIRRNGVNIQLNTNVNSVKKVGDKFIVDTTKGEFVYDKVIIATGGISYKSTGSTGDGYRIAKSFNHTIIDQVAGLVPILLNDSFIKQIEGISLKNVTLSAYNGNKLVSQEFGEMLFTRGGISGPIVLTTSSLINRIPKNNVKLVLDFKPALTEEMLDNRLIREFSDNQNKNLINVINGLLPKSLVAVFLIVAGINGHTKINSVTKEIRHKIIQYLKNFPLSFDRLDTIDNAVITAGGVKTTEINPKTMESKLVKGLYFAGEVIDVDAFTGGYNLQIAFSTGYIAGLNVGSEN